MAPVMIFPDVAALVATFLRDEFTTRGVQARVGSRVPADWPAGAAVGFVRVERQGGPRRNLVTDQAQLALEAYASEAERAYVLIALVRGLVGSTPGRLLGGHAVYRVDEYAGPGLLPDPVTDSPRYVYTVAMHIRGVEES